MPIAAITSLSPEAISFQSFSPDGKVRSVFHLPWTAIEQIDVFKRDLFAYDLICLQIQQSNGETIEIDEEDLSWQAFLEGCAAQLDGFLPWGTWFGDVAFPAFETNLQTVYRRAGTAPPVAGKSGDPVQSSSSDQ